jgi:hypothetical protein
VDYSLPRYYSSWGVYDTPQKLEGGFATPLPLRKEEVERLDLELSSLFAKLARARTNSLKSSICKKIEGIKKRKYKILQLVGAHRFQEVEDYMDDYED